jgi:predicted metal-dependent peptidase
MSTTKKPKNQVVGVSDERNITVGKVLPVARGKDKDREYVELEHEGETFAIALPAGENKQEEKPKKRKKNKKVIDPKNMPTQQQIEEKLITARIGLLIRQPFFGTMATHLTIIRDDETVQTAATDGRNFYYNLEFIAGLTTKQTEFLFGHEVLHNVFEHHLRREVRHPKLWNVACDYAVNEILVDSNIGEKIDNLLYDPKYKGKCAEEIFDDLFKNMDKLDIEALTDKLLDEHLEDLAEQGKGLSEAEKEKVRNEIKESLLDSVQAAAGKLPAGVSRLVNDLTQPKMNWKELLRQDIQSVIKTDFSFYRPNKKGQSSGYVLPGMIKEHALDICVAIDTSGSINDDDLRVFLSEIQGIMSQYTDYVIRVWSFDTEVHADETFRSDEGADITGYKAKGGGGTLFEANFKYMVDNDIQPKIFIMFTDMCPNNGWGDPLYCDNVIFVGYKSGGRQAPFGTTITMD